MTKPENRPENRSESRPDGRHEAQPTRSFTVSPARKVAASILLQLEQRSTHADELLRSPRVDALSLADRHLATTLVMGVVRWRILLDARVELLLTRPAAKLDPEIRIALRLAAFQILFLERIPVHAAINESVALAKIAGHRFAAGMVNAVLRKLVQQHESVAIPGLPATPGDLAAAYAHPVWIVERWVARFGFDQAKLLCQHGQQQPEIALRIPDADQAAEIERELETEGIQLAPGALLSSARRLVSGDLAGANVLREARIRIQDEGSQLIAELAGEGQRILDCCAAPGGKTLILAERNPHARIVACEASPARLAAMRERFSTTANQFLARGVETRLIDATTLFRLSRASDSTNFDLALVDAPCSGTGTLGRNPEIRHRLRPEDLALHHQRQCALLRAALDVSDQRVLYSTCSLEPEENQEVVAEVLAENPRWKKVSLLDRIESLRRQNRLTPLGAEYLHRSLLPNGALQLMPAAVDENLRVSTDSFYLAIFERIEHG